MFAPAVAGDGVTEVVTAASGLSFGPAIAAGLTVGVVIFGARKAWRVVKSLI